ncbi:MAG TPA: FAD-dependent oxidoreductase, partial [Polyangiales bacterium]|nr:FAD-dependent oxidoreductase [Polyangiales bacterium]
MPREHDVVVVGAGLAGLRAAQLLREAGKRVLILEARDRVGGRTLTVPFAGRFIDLGAQWIGPQQRRVCALAKSLGVATEDQYVRGKAQWILGTTRGTMKGTLPALPALQVLKLLATLTRMEIWARKVPKNAPWLAARASEWDKLSVEDHLGQYAGKGLAREMISTSMRVLFAAEPRDISLLHALYYIHVGGGMTEITSTRGGAQHWWFPKGAGSLATRLAKNLDVNLEEPVQAIDASAAQLQITSARARYLARRVIVALPPVLTQNIRWDPVLPEARIGLANATPMGKVIKCFVQYARPFWRDAGWSGEAFSDGVAGLIMDATVPSMSEGTLAVFLLGDQAQHYSGKPEDRRRAVLSALIQQFGPDAGHPQA